MVNLFKEGEQQQQRRPDPVRNFEAYRCWLKDTFGRDALEQFDERYSGLSYERVMAKVRDEQRWW